MDIRAISEVYTEIGHDLIENEDVFLDIRNSQATIIFLSSQHKKIANGKTVFAQCEKVADKYKWGIPCDFTITVFEPNVVNFSDDQLRILLFHELLHVGIEFNSDGTETYSVLPHDLEDFKIVIDRYGTNWSVTNEEE